MSTQFNNLDKSYNQLNIVAIMKAKGSKDEKTCPINRRKKFHENQIKR